MAGLGPAIHVFLRARIARRGWPAFAGHDDGAKPWFRVDRNSRIAPIVMAGLGPGIHVFLCSRIARRGWPAFAGHDDGAQPLFRVDSYALTLKPGRRGLHCEPHSQS
jgi:hypothetical protein